MKKVLYEELLPEEICPENAGNAGCISASWYIRMAWSAYAS